MREFPDQATSCEICEEHHIHVRCIDIGSMHLYRMRLEWTCDECDDYDDSDDFPPSCWCFREDPHEFERGEDQNVVFCSSCHTFSKHVCCMTATELSWYKYNETYHCEDCCDINGQRPCHGTCNSRCPIAKRQRRQEVIDPQVEEEKKGEPVERQAVARPNPASDRIDIDIKVENKEVKSISVN